MSEQDMVAGRLLVLGMTHPSRDVRLWAEAAAKVVAQHGLDEARGWLRGVWYVGGVRPIVGSDVALSYHDVVGVLQVPLGLQLVTAS